MNVKTPRNGAKPVDKVMILKQNAKFFRFSLYLTCWTTPPHRSAARFSIYLSISICPPTQGEEGHAVTNGQAASA